LSVISGGVAKSHLVARGQGLSWGLRLDLAHVAFKPKRLVVVTRLHALAPLDSSVANDQV